MLQQIQCRQCGGVIPASDINLDRMVAKCSFCNVLQSLDELGSAPVTAPPAPGPHKPTTVPQPQNTVFSVRGGQLELVQRWFSAAHIALLFFVIPWDAFLLFWYSIVLTQKHVPLIMAIFPVGHLAVGVCLTYFVLCGFLNKTFITVGRGELTIRFSPLPCPGQQVLRTGDLDQLYCQQQYGQRGAVSYHLNALLKSGKKVKLVGGFSDVDQARFLERKIEEFLQIEDRPVAGEFVG